MKDTVPQKQPEQTAKSKYDTGLRVACGVFGIFDHDDAAALTALGLHALQHRGQEAAGIVTYDGTHYHYERRMGLVGDHFTKESVISQLKGDYAIGHVRYSTTGTTVGHPRAVPRPASGGPGHSRPRVR